MVRKKSLSDFLAKQRRGRNNPGGGEASQGGGCSIGGEKNRILEGFVEDPKKRGKVEGEKKSRQTREISQQES